MLFLFGGLGLKEGPKRVGSVPSPDPASAGSGTVSGNSGGTVDSAHGLTVDGFFITQLSHRDPRNSPSLRPHFSEILETCSRFSYELQIIGVFFVEMTDDASWLVSNLTLSFGESLQ